MFILCFIFPKKMPRFFRGISISPYRKPNSVPSDITSEIDNHLSSPSIARGVKRFFHAPHGGTRSQVPDHKLESVILNSGISVRSTDTTLH